MADAPERVLQFGTGAFMRAFMDDFIHQANSQGHYHGRVVLVASTASGRSQLFREQGGLYTLLEEGFQAGTTQRNLHLSGAVSRVLSARDQWEDVLACIRQPELDVITSNTTEAGLSFQSEATLQAPKSFPGRVTALLYERFRHFQGVPTTGLVLLPCELIPDNGSALREMVVRHLREHELGTAFEEWVLHANTFCNTLVDRIVSGRPAPDRLQALEQELGYRDELLTVSELYRLLAIEGDDALSQRLPFLRHPEVVLRPDISDYRERKLRILNGLHTLMVPVGFLSGLNTVAACMEEEAVRTYLEQMLEREILPTLQGDDLPAYAREVLDRFRNPFLHHQLLSISLQTSFKMRTRELQTLLRYLAQYGTPPSRMCLGFAAYISFMCVQGQDDEGYYGVRDKEPYAIQDMAASFFYSLWESVNFELDSLEASRQVVQEVMGNQAIWEEDLSVHEALCEQIAQHLWGITRHGMAAYLNQFQSS